jgi:rubredoxin
MYVPKGCACPECGENRVDYLSLDDDEMCECQTCGFIYDVYEIMKRSE